MVKLYSHRDIEIVTRPPAAARTYSLAKAGPERSERDAGSAKKRDEDGLTLGDLGVFARDKVFGFQGVGRLRKTNPISGLRIGDGPAASKIRKTNPIPCGARRDEATGT